MRFSLRQLEVFSTTARLGSISLAAGELAMSQSAASTALSELERRSGRALFDRAGKRLMLNELGRTLLPHALDLLDKAREMDALLAGRVAPLSLKLGATVTIGNYLAPTLIERFRRRYPDAAVTLDVANTDAIAARVASLELDLGLIEGEYSDPDLTIGKWLDDELVVFCSPAHRLADGDAFPVDAVLAEKWAVRERGSGTRQTLDRAMRAYWTSWKIGIELQHIEAIIGIVAAGSMIGAVSRLALSDALASRRVVEVRVPDLDLRRQLYTVSHRRRHKTASTAAFLELMRSA